MSYFREILTFDSLKLGHNVMPSRPLIGMGGTQNFVHGIYREKIPRYRVYRGTCFMTVLTLSLIHI